jgi:hypothetical protein
LRASRPKLGSNAPYEIGIAAGKINIETALVNSLQKSVEPKGHFLHLRWTWEGSEHYPAVPSYLGGGSCALRSSVYQWLNCLRSDVMDHHGITGLPNIPGNRPAYGTQTDKAYHFHFSTS